MCATIAVSLAFAASTKCDILRAGSADALNCKYTKDCEQASQINRDSWLQLSMGLLHPRKWTQEICRADLSTWMDPGNKSKPISKLTVASLQQHTDDSFSESAFKMHTPAL